MLFLKKVEIKKQKAEIKKQKVYPVKSFVPIYPVKSHLFVFNWDLSR